MLGRHLLGRHLQGRHLPGRNLPGHHLLVLWCDRENWNLTSGQEKQPRHLSGVLGRLSGVLDGVSDLLGVESCLGAGIDDCTAGLAGVSGAVPWSIRRCYNVHIDIKSISVTWLMEVGIDGKSGLPVPVKMEAWESPGVCRPRVFSSDLHSSICGGPTRQSWAVPPQKCWKPQTSVHRT